MWFKHPLNESAGPTFVSPPCGASPYRPVPAPVSVCYKTRKGSLSGGQGDRGRGGRGQDSPLRWQSTHDASLVLPVTLPGRPCHLSFEGEGRQARRGQVPAGSRRNQGPEPFSSRVPAETPCRVVPCWPGPEIRPDQAPQDPTRHRRAHTAPNQNYKCESRLCHLFAAPKPVENSTRTYHNDALKTARAV